MMLRSVIRIGMLLLVLPAAHSYAGEILARGKVVRVEPINARSQVIEYTGDCEPAKPAHGADMVALLAWDLRVGCRATNREVDSVEGYRVYYEWDDRVYNTVVTDVPADTIPLRVSVH
jgi:hypothetical protein